MTDQKHQETATMTVTEYQRAYRANNPEKVVRWRITQAVRLLKRYGYTVLEPAQEGGQA